MALSKTLGRQKILKMPIQSKTGLNTIIVTEVELDHCIFHMEFHTILQGFELCLPCLKRKFGETENLLDVLMEGEN
jgi:hypothetical protein